MKLLVEELAAHTMTAENNKARRKEGYTTHHHPFGFQKELMASGAFELARPA